MKRLLPVVFLLTVPVESQAPRSWAGSGDSVSSPIALQAGLVKVSATYKGDRNFIVRMEPAAGQYGRTVVNTIGAYRGTRILQVDAASYRFSVRSAGSWELLYEPIPVDRQAVAIPVARDGRGDDALGPFLCPSGLLLATISHKGTSNVVVVAYRPTGERLGTLVNEIGAYSGTVSLRVREAGACWLDIHADGAWSVKLGQ